MSARTDVRRPGAPAGATPGVAGWYPDPFSDKLRRWWTGQSWTFSTTDPTLSPDAPPPPPPRAATPLPASVAPPPVKPKEPWSERFGRMIKGRRIVVAVVLGLIVGLLGARALHNPARPTTSALAPAPTQGRTGTSTPATTAPINNDPSATALSSLIVKPADVTAPTTVALLPGGAGLGVATLDLCNGTFPSDGLRTARLQDAAFDAQDSATLSTEAVLYRDSAATTQAFSELKSVAAACPSTPVQSPDGQSAVITKFNPAPDGSWPQTATVKRLAYDFTTTDASGQATHTIAVYLQRGRALMGVYFFQPDGDQAAIAGQTTVPGIVGVFSGRMAALPSSVVGS
ncbi:MAG: DUF2510 domain-containing protein [Actinomycetota bacterium]|nr:DUF2510 domain-containing protein [Actinomycetota bacterium]